MPDQPAASDVKPDAAGPNIDGGDVTTGVGSAPLCDEENPFYGVRCNKAAGHEGIHIYFGSSFTFAWGYGGGMTIRER